MKELFANAAYGMFDIIADLEGLKSSVSIEVKAEAPNQEELLVAWLDELLYNFCTKQIILCEFDIKELDEKHIKAEAKGRHVGDNRNRLKTEVKAVTFHELKIEQAGGEFTAQVIFDI